MIRRFALAAVVLLAGCQSDYQFHTVAIYEAPRGEYRIHVEGMGVVKGGHDISEEANGAFTVSPSGPPKLTTPEPLMVEVALRGSRVHYGRLFLPDDAAREEIVQSISGLLSSAGYSTYPDEIQELVSAVEGVLMGPKGTHMDGQTKVLKVVSTNFNR